jgi:hypothetical protein
MDSPDMRPWSENRLVLRAMWMKPRVTVWLGSAWLGAERSDTGSHCGVGRRPECSLEKRVGSAPCLIGASGLGDERGRTRRQVQRAIRAAGEFPHCFCAWMHPSSSLHPFPSVAATPPTGHQDVVVTQRLLCFTSVLVARTNQRITGQQHT